MPDHSYKPAYRIIIDDILEGINRGTYAADQPIPSQAKLAEHYKVSRITARDAINELTHRGVLYTIQGKGTFVSRPSKFAYPTTRSQGFSIGMSGQNVETRVLDIGYLEADRALAARLEVPPAKALLSLRRLRIIEGIPSVVSHTYLDCERFAGIDFLGEDFAASSLYRTLERKAAFRILYVDEEIRAVGCPAAVAELLGIPAGEPVLHILRYTHEQDERCVEWGEQYERSDVAGMKIRSYNK